MNMQANTPKAVQLLRRTLAGAAILMVTLPASASWFDNWNSKAVDGSGKIIKQERVVRDFRSVVIAVPGKVELKQGDQEMVQIETDDNLQTLLEAVVENNTLKIRSRDKGLYPHTKTLNVIVYLKKLDDLALEGSGSIASGALSANDLKIRIGGSGNIALKELKADSLKVTIGGSGSFSAGGSVPQVAGSIGGSGEMDIAKLVAKDVRLSIGGSGSVQTWVSDNLNVSIGGSGNVSYYGDPKVSKSIGGSGSVVRKGATP
jgi:hypothetical protein